MEVVKKVFGGINLTWKKLIIFAIFAGIYAGIMAMIAVLKDTSFSDIAVSFEVWILFGILIIMNSKSAKDSALKCLVFFVISQPLIYLVQDVINHTSLFVTYYRNWIGWTIACIPMGYIGFFMKKDKWWGLLILVPIMILLGLHFEKYLGETIFSFPRHFLTAVFCALSLVIYPIAIFRNKKIQIFGVIIGGTIIIAMTIMTIVKPFEYNTDILISGEEYQFDDSYKVYLADSKYGELRIRYEKGIEAWMVSSNFKHAGKTEFTLESPNGEKTVFEITIKRDTYDVKRKK